MLRLNRLAFLLLACCCHLFSAAQTTNCTADFNYSVANSNVVSFTAKDSTGAIHHWLFGDGGIAVLSTNGNITHSYLKPGKYEVKHYIERPNTNCRDSAVKTITLEWVDQCNASFYYQKDSSALRWQFFSNSSSVTGIKKLYWNFGDNSFSDAQNPVHTFAKPGTYNVCLSIETNSGCTSQHCVQLQLTDSSNTCLLKPAFQYHKDSASCKKIYFNNLSAPATTPVQYSWNFGDGASSHDANPVHVYTQTGKYYVCLLAEAGTGCRKEFCDSVMVRCDSACNIVARFEWKKDSASCEKIHFFNYSVPATPNALYSWLFGDGTISNDASPLHTYNKQGKYLVCITVTNGNCKNYYCDSVTVRCEEACNMQPSFNWKTTEGSTRLYFTNLTIATTTAVHYTWYFGDSSYSHDINPMHVYAQTGRYTVCLVAETNNCRKETCQQIEIKACNVVARFEKRQAASNPHMVYFSNVSQPVNNIWQTYWTYGDGTASRDYNSYHLYDKPGMYHVCLKVISLNGCISEYCDTIRIAATDSCVINANFSHYSASSGSPSVKFEALYQSNTAAYNWNFGDSTAGIGRIAYHTYNKSGKYNVCLTIKDGHCTSSHCETITIEKSANAGRVAVFPNPAINTVTVEVNLDLPGQLTIRFLDGSGGERSSFSRTGASGSNRYSLPVEKLSHGIYLVEIKSNSGSWISRFVKG